MANLESLISEAVSLKMGNREFALFFDGEESWQAHIGNPTNCVGLGEVSGDIVGEGNSAMLAVGDLIEKIKGFR